MILNIQNQVLIDLIESSLEANYSGVKEAASKIAKSVNNEDPDIARIIKSLIRKKGVPLRSSGYVNSLPTDPKSRLHLLEETHWPIVPIFLNENEKDIFSTFIEDALNVDKLIKFGLAGNLNLLLSGPPGTGKTLVAGHIASQLDKPLYTARLDSMISSLLGDTAKNIRSVFDFVAQKEGVLFLDEVDAVAKLRNDKHEVGELKRVVNTLIQGLDSLDDSSIVIAATNHAELLDPAIWRRFPYSIEFNLPDQELREEFWNYFLFSDAGDQTLIKSLAILSKGLTGSDIKNIAHAAIRKSVLSEEKINIPRIVEALTKSKTGKTIMPNGSKIESADKKKIAKDLHKNFGFPQVEISKILNVSRQAVSGYLKEPPHV